MTPGTMREGEKSQRTGKAQVASERDGLGQLIREKVLQLESALALAVSEA